VKLPDLLFKEIKVLAGREGNDLVFFRVRFNYFKARETDRAS
jgi:hypothetical protein